MKYFPNKVISSQVSFDLSQKPKSDMWEIVGGPRRSKEQSLPAYPSLQVQLPKSWSQTKQFHIFENYAAPLGLFMKI